MEPDQTLQREDVLIMLGACPERVRDYVMGLDESRLAYRHGPAFPTLRELVLHVSETGSAADTALRHACLDGASEVDTRAALEPSLEAPEAVAPALEKLADLGRVRRRTMDLLRGLTAADWERVLVDPSIGELTVLDFCRLVAQHEMGHLSQVRNLTSLLPD
jgi:DinB superfamily